jgi:thioredoxin-like negative regulator of GroEL
VAAVLVLGIGAAAHAGDGPDLEAALTEARDDDKPVIVEFTADWCKPCKKFKKTVLSDSLVRESLRDVVFVECDIETTKGEEIHDRYGGGSLPSFLLLDTNGLELHRVSGYQEKPEFLELLEQARWLGASEPVLSDAEGAEEYQRAAQWYQARSRNSEAIDLFERAAEADPTDAQGVGASAVWRARQLRLGLERRKSAIGAAIAQIESYPGTKTATKALGRAALSGGLSPQRVEELMKLHLDRLPDDTKQLHYLVYVGIAAKAYESAVAAARKLVAAEQSSSHFFAAADAHLHAGDRDEALRNVRRCSKSAKSRSARRSCKELERRVTSNTLTSRGVVHVQRDVDAYFMNLEKPGNDGDRERERIDADARRARMGADRERDVSRAMEFMKKSRGILSKVGRDCSRHRGALDEAWVRLRFFHSSKQPTRVVVLEPEASDSLRRCLREALATTEFPPPPSYMRNQHVGRVRFFDEVQKAKGPRMPMPRDVLRLEWLLAGRRGGGRYGESTLAARILVPLSKREGGLGPVLHFDGEIGRTSADEALYGINALIGAAVSNHPARLGFFLGGGLSGAGEAVPFAWQLPIELSVSVEAKNLRAVGWARMTWTTSEVRDGGSENGLLDELDLGLGVRIPAAWKRGVLVGIYHRELLGDSVTGLMIGTGHKRFY